MVDTMIHPVNPKENTMSAIICEKKKATESSRSLMRYWLGSTTFHKLGQLIFPTVYFGSEKASDFDIPK